MVVRFSNASRTFSPNPGQWVMHCHNAYHMEGGMARVDAGG